MIGLPIYLHFSRLIIFGLIVSARSSSTSWHVACLSLWPVSLLAGAFDPSTNLLACQQRLPSCDRSRLTLAEVTDLALARADHARKVTDCRSGLVRCVRKAAATAIAPA